MNQKGKAKVALGSAELVQLVERHIELLSQPERELSLHLIGRLERALQKGHVSNLIRLDVFDPSQLKDGDA